MPYPFDVLTDPAGHNVVGLAFPRPIPWPLFLGDSAQPKPGLVEGITAVLDETQESHEAALNDLRNEVRDCGYYTDEIHLALAGAVSTLLDVLNEKPGAPLTLGDPARLRIEDALSHLRAAQDFRNRLVRDLEAKLKETDNL